MQGNDRFPAAGAAGADDRPAGGLAPALLLAAATLVWFVIWWFALPLWSRLRSRAYADPLEFEDAAPAPDGRPRE